MSAREDAVDFTHPFMSVNLSVIYKRPPPGYLLPFQDLEGLVESRIPFGIVRGCSLHIILKKSKRPLYQLIYQRLEEWGEDVYVRSLEAGIGRVLQGNYAFLGDITCVDLYPEELVAVGPRYLPTMFYALATSKGSPLCRSLGRAVLELAEQGDIEQLREKWCKHR